MIMLQPFVRYAVKTRHFLPRFSIAGDCRLICVLSGNGTFDADDETYCLKEGSLVYYPCGTRYRISSSEKNGLLFYTVNFDFTQDNSHLTDTLYPVAEKDFDPDAALRSYECVDEFFSKSKYIPKASFAVPLLESVCDEQKSRQAGFREIQCSQMTLLLIGMMRAAHAESSGDTVCAQVRSLVEEDLSVTNEKLAQLLGYHPYYLNSYFKKREGITLHQYVLHRRLSRAYELIVTTCMPMSEIANACGFSSQSHFSDLFQKHYRVRPIGLRKQI